MEISHKQRKNAWIGFGLGLVLAAAIIIVLIATTGNANTNQVPDQTNNTETEQTSSGDMIFAKDMKPYASGPFIYTFENIRWVFESIENTNKQKAKVWFEKFSRRQSNTYVNFREPYKLGTYTGECKQIESIQNPSVDFEDRPVSFAECITNEGKGTQFVVTQDENNIEFQVRSIVSGQATGDFNTIYTLDMTKMVR